MKLKDLRLAKGLTLREVSEKIGVSLVHLSRLENGESNPKSMRLWTAVQLAGLYGCAVTDLI